VTSPLLKAPFGYLFTGLPAQTIEESRDDMIQRFETRRAGLRDNKAYYESQRRPDAIGISVPKEMQKLMAHVGYPRLYVDAISERLEVEGFRLGGGDDADDELWEWWQANDLDIESPLGHTDALVHGRSYITISAPDPDLDADWDQTVPIIRVESPTDLYAVIDHRTRCVLQAVRVVYELDQHMASFVSLYLPNRTVSWSRAGGDWSVYQDEEHKLGVVPVVPITNRISTSDLYGTSQITPEIRAVTDAAARILMDMQGAAELMALPQRLLFGVDPGELGVDPDTGESKFNAAMARILSFEAPEGKAFQFAAAELRNFGDALDQLDRKAASYTGLPPQYLSVTSDNPASAEAIAATESRFIKACERKNSLFGGSWEKAMRIAYAVMNGGIASLPSKFNRMESIWRDPSTPTYAAKADGATKLYAGGTGVIPKKRARKDMGYSIVEIEDMEKWDEEEMQGLFGAYATGPGSVVGAPIAAPAAPTGAPAASPASPVKAAAPAAVKK
jgi:hypothetical protein